MTYCIVCMYILCVQVCVVLFRNDSSGTSQRDCVDANTSGWHIPVSIGSSIGAVLALSIIVFIVLLSRCPSLVRHHRASASESSKYDSMTSSRYHDHDLSDTTTQCGHDHDDDVFTSDGACDSHPLDSGASSHCSCHTEHHYPRYPALPERLLSNGNKNHAFVGMGMGGGGIHSPRRPRRLHGGSLRAHSLSGGVCTRSNSLERPRPHRGHRRAHLMALHSAHQSIQSEPTASNVNITTTPSSVTAPRPLHVSISDLPPAVHIPDLDAPVSSLVQQSHAAPLSAPLPGTPSTAAAASGPTSGISVPIGGARAKTNLKDTARTFHMSIDFDV